MKTNVPINVKLQALLARCDAVRRAADLGRPIKFDRKGEAHARSVAALDEQRKQAAEVR